MTTFNSSFDWDSNLPPSISSLDENDFMLLLQKQFPAVNANLVSPANLSKDKIDNANPQSLSNFQLPSTSPLSTDSSPSPPSAHDDNNSFNESEGNNSNSKRASSLEDDHHKRKASASDFDDEINGQPNAKSQHTDSRKRNSLSQSRRRSTGEKPQDETRLLKRKEQNRAAQRAFRERKEKHVKDLEDKVASLEAKTETQAAENENLRDMLSRLQNENIMLKQTAFTFSVPSSSNGPTSQSSNTASSRLPSQQLELFAKNNATAGPSRAPTSAGSSVATASTHDSPSSIFDGFDSFSTMNSRTTRSSAAATPATNTTNSPSSTDMDTMALFGSPGPFTTISSNPMYMSYCDPVQSMNAFASFGGWDSDINMNMASTTTTDNAEAGLEDLFGEQFSGLIPFGGEFLTGGTTDTKLSPSAASTSSVSPIGHPKPEHGADGHNQCPKTKEDVERLIASGPKGTFGASPVAGSDGKSPEILTPQAGAHEYESAFHQALGQQQPLKATLGDVYNIDDLCLEMQRKAKCSIGGSCSSA